MMAALRVFSTVSFSPSSSLRIRSRRSRTSVVSNFMSCDSPRTFSVSARSSRITSITLDMPISLALQNLMNCCASRRHFLVEIGKLECGKVPQRTFEVLMLRCHQQTHTCLEFRDNPVLFAHHPLVIFDGYVSIFLFCHCCIASRAKFRLLIIIVIGGEIENRAQPFNGFGRFLVRPAAPVIATFVFSYHRSPGYTTSPHPRCCT
jgi:hypothetical protein